jgi:thiol-disulfide isomerase/thioredoxin
MLYLTEPIVYLVNKDFDTNGNLINPRLKDKKVIIMIQAAFCGHCTNAKPAYQEFGDKNQNKFIIATIQGDGTQLGEKELNQMLKKIDPQFRGFPAYVGYKNGVYVKTHNGGRSAQDLQMFADSL